MPLSKAGRKMLANFKKEYGDKEGISNFYAYLNKNPEMKHKMEGKPKYMKKVSEMG